VHRIENVRGVTGASVSGACSQVPIQSPRWTIAAAWAL